MGCTATAIIGACLALGGDALDAVAHGLAITGIAGDMAARGARGPGSMQVAFLDALAALDENLLKTEPA
jgi:hydroxyethylthiazole kinase